MRYNRKTVSVITSPLDTSTVTRVIDTAEMKNYLRVTADDEDSLIEEFIDIATDKAKQFMRRSVLKETLELTMDGFGTSEDDGSHDVVGTRQSVLGMPPEVDLPFPPIQSITSIKTYGTTNVESTFTSTYYTLDTTGGRVFLNQGQVWPSDLRDRAAVKIKYVAGYGSSGKDVPAPIRMAIRMYV